MAVQLKTYHAETKQGEHDEPRDVRAAALLQRFPVTFDLQMRKGMKDKT